MLWLDLNREVAATLQGNSALADQRPFIVIDTRQQQLHCIDIEAENNRSYSVSTAANGVGNRLDSYKTPFGIHRICQKVGGGQLPGRCEGRDDPQGTHFKRPPCG